MITLNKNRNKTRSLILKLAIYTIIPSIAIAITSCGTPRVLSQPVHLYAVKGSEIKSTPYIKGVAYPTKPYSGTITFTWPTGETGTGHYSGIANFSYSSTSHYSNASGTGYGSVGPTSYNSSANTPYGNVDVRGNIGASDIMLSTYQSTHGRSFSRSLSPGQIPIQGMMVTNNGRRIEFIGAAGSGTDNGIGVAKDNRGNVWKVIF